MGLVYKVNNNWEDIQSYWEVDKKDPHMMFPYDGLCQAYLPAMLSPITIIRSGSKYGVYAPHHGDQTCMSSTCCNPTSDPFPYDEVLYYTPFSHSIRMSDPESSLPALFAFRIGCKWGVIEVVKGWIQTKEKYDAEYPLTKRRILINCECATMTEVEERLGNSYQWQVPKIDPALGDCSNAGAGTSQCVLELMAAGYDMNALPLKMFTRKSNNLNTPNNMPTWNSSNWQPTFRTASQRRNADALHNLRIDVYKNTLACVKAGGYTSATGALVTLNLTNIGPAHNHFYSRPFTVAPTNTGNCHIEVVEGDCLEFAKSLTEPLQRGEVAVLNMANRQNPGGGVMNGAGAQEEYLFRCSDYYRFLYRYKDYASQYGLSRARESYPMDRNHGGIFSCGVTVFRGPEEEGYPLLDAPWKVNFIAVAGINRPETVTVNGEQRLTDDMAQGNLNKIRTILRIAIDNHQRVLVLGALGCGAFRNPPKHMAELFNQALHETEFNGAFDAVYFAIKNDHNSQVNYNIFKQVIG